MQVARSEETKTKKPERTCSGCARRDDASAMVRLVLGPLSDAGAAEVAVDLEGGSFGRGAHVHARVECLTKACRGGLSRAFKCKVVVDASELAQHIVAATDRRMTGLLLGARRSRVLAVGADASLEALARQTNTVTVVACDAGSIVERGPIAQAVASGRAVAWKTKSDIGRLLGRDEVAVCVIESGSIGEALLKARSMADALLQIGSFACRSEVR